MSVLVSLEVCVLITQRANRILDNEWREGGREGGREGENKWISHGTYIHFMKDYSLAH